jgi:hypothetical protein
VGHSQNTAPNAADGRRQWQDYYCATQPQLTRSCCCEGDMCGAMVGPDVSLEGDESDLVRSARGVYRHNRWLKANAPVPPDREPEGVPRVGHWRAKGRVQGWAGVSARGDTIVTNRHACARWRHSLASMSGNLAGLTTGVPSALWYVHLFGP